MSLLIYNINRHYVYLYKEAKLNFIYKHICKMFDMAPFIFVKSKSLENKKNL